MQWVNWFHFVILSFQSLTSGVDSLVLQKKSELEELKQESFFQRKQAKTEEEESKEKGAKKKKWINLDAAGFEDFDGTISGDEEEVKSAQPVDKKKEAEKVEEEDGEKNPAGIL